jgi:hypothetical protein
MIEALTEHFAKRIEGAAQALRLVEEQLDGFLECGSAREQ